jgi:hypothetical protein
MAKLCRIILLMITKAIFTLKHYFFRFMSGQLIFHPPIIFLRANKGIKAGVDSLF